MALCFVLGTQNKLPSASRAVCLAHLQTGKEGEERSPGALFLTDFVHPLVVSGIPGFRLAVIGFGPRCRLGR